MESFRELFQDQIKDLHNAEIQILAAMPKMVKVATNEALKAGLEQHEKETQQQVKRLEQIADGLGLKLKGKKCQAMEGLIKEAEEVIEEGGVPEVVDAALIAAAQRIEHYEISGYGTVRIFAEQLGYDEAVELLEETLEEEANANELLTQIAEEEVNAEAAETDEELEDQDFEDEEEEELSATEEEAVRR